MSKVHLKQNFSFKQKMEPRCCENSIELCQTEDCKVPDDGPRITILRSNLRKSPVAKDVNLSYMGKMIRWFSDADLTVLM